jgi:hypothetical protein
VSSKINGKGNVEAHQFRSEVLPRSIAVNGWLAFLSRKCGLAGPAEPTVKAY